ncbi:dockerin type I domain-containing protein [Ruminococcus albus]
MSDDEKLRADVNGDGIINITDISKIAAHIKGEKLLS